MDREGINGRWFFHQFKAYLTNFAGPNVNEIPASERSGYGYHEVGLRASEEINASATESDYKSNKTGFKYVTEWSDLCSQLNLPIMIESLDACESSFSNVEVLSRRNGCINFKISNHSAPLSIPVVDTLEHIAHLISLYCSVNIVLIGRQFDGTTRAVLNRPFETGVTMCYLYDLINQELGTVSLPSEFMMEIFGSFGLRSTSLSVVVKLPIRDHLIISKVFTSDGVVDSVCEWIHYKDVIGLNYDNITMKTYAEMSNGDLRAITFSNLKRAPTFALARGNRVMFESELYRILGIEYDRKMRSRFREETLYDKGAALLNKPNVKWELVPFSSSHPVLNHGRFVIPKNIGGTVVKKLHESAYTRGPEYLHFRGLCLCWKIYRIHTVLYLGETDEMPEFYHVYRLANEREQKVYHFILIGTVTQHNSYVMPIYYLNGASDRLLTLEDFVTDMKLVGFDNPLYHAYPVNENVELLSGIFEPIISDPSYHYRQSTTRKRLFAYPLSLYGRGMLQIKRSERDKRILSYTRNCRYFKSEDTGTHLVIQGILAVNDLMLLPCGDVCSQNSPVVNHHRCVMDALFKNEKWKCSHCLFRNDARYLI